MEFGIIDGVPNRIYDVFILSGYESLLANHSMEQALRSGENPGLIQGKQT